MTASNANCEKRRLLSAGTRIASGTAWMSENEAGELFAPRIDIPKKKSLLLFTQLLSCLSCLLPSHPYSSSPVELCRLRYWLHWREQNADEITSLKQWHVNFVAEFINNSHFPQNDKEKLNELLKLQFAVFSAVLTWRKHWHCSVSLAGVFSVNGFSTYICTDIDCTFFVTRWAPLVSRHSASNWATFRRPCLAIQRLCGQYSAYGPLLLDPNTFLSDFYRWYSAVSHDVWFIGYLLVPTS